MVEEGQAAGDIGETRSTPAASPSGWRSKITLSLCAFVMSLAMTAISAYHGLRGSDIVIVAPKQVILFRDGEGAASILSVAARFDMVNAAADYGDVVLETNVRFGKGGPSFAYAAPVKSVFTGQAKEAAQDCGIDARCIALTGLLVVEQPDEIIDLAGGGARTITLNFPVAEWNCGPGSKDCTTLAGFDKAVATMGNKPLELEFEVKLNSDGRRRIRCTTPPVDSRYLAQAGWISLACEKRSVADA